MITQQIQTIQYLGSDVVNINSLLNLQNVDKIYFIDQNSNYVGWFSEIQHNYLQGLLDIQPGQMYIVYSKNSANYPYSLFLDYPDVHERLVSLEEDVVTASGALNNEAVNIYNQLVAASGSLHDETIAASGDLNLKYVDVYDKLVAASGSLHDETVDVYNQLVAASGSLHDETVDVYDQLVAASGSLHSLDLDLINLLVITSGSLRDAIVAASGDLYNQLVAASGSLHNETVDVYDQLVAASGSLHDETVDVYNHLVAASGSLRDETVDVYNHLVAASGSLRNETVDVYNHLVAASGSLHDETVAASGDLYNQLVAASGSLHDETVDVYDQLVAASGSLHDETVAASGDLYNQLVAASGSLHDETVDVYDQLVAASGSLHDETVAASGDLYNQLVAASGSLHDETVDVYNHLVAASGSLHDETVAASGDLYNQLVAASGHLYDISVAQPRYSFGVTANSTDPNNTSAFRFTGVGISESNQDNPDIYLRRGETYVFDINSRHHPFYIKTERVVGTSSMYNAGVTNNGFSDRAITFEVPYDAPNVLYYQCSNHASMGGNLYTYQPSATSRVDGGLADSFTDSGGGGGGGGEEEVYDTTYSIATANVPVGQPGGGLTFYGSVGDSIEFTIVTSIDNPLNLITLNIYVSGSQLALLTITPEYRNGGKTFKATINGTAYVLNFSAGTLVSGTTYRLDL